jgi:uncharacterized protein YciU (UPF0263 family)
MAKDNSIELAYNEFDTMVGKFLEQANVLNLNCQNKKNRRPRLIP